MKARKKIALLLFFIFFVSGAYFFHPVEGWNEISRYALITSLVDHGRLDLDLYDPPSTGFDLAFHGGHYYSCKGIGVPLLGIPIYWAWKELFGLPGAFTFEDIELTLSAGARYAVRVFSVTLPHGILGAVLFWAATALGASPGSALVMVLAYGFGSLAWMQSMVLSGHQTAAAFSFFAYAVLLHSTRQEGRRAEVSFFAGLLAGMGALSDFLAMGTALLLSLYVLTLPTCWKNRLLFFSGGGFTALLMGIYNHFCFGGFFSLPYHHLTTALHREGASTGLYGVGLPYSEAIVGTLFSPARGLFFIMPFFLFSFYGLIRLARDGKHSREALLMLGIIGFFLWANTGFYAWHGGLTFGPRYLVPMLPFLALPLAFSPVKSLSFGILLLFGVVQVGVAVVVYFNVPHLIKNPFLEVILPFARYGYWAMNGGNRLGLSDPYSLVPVLAVLGGSILLLARITGSPEKIKVPKSLTLISFFLVLFILANFVFVRSAPETVYVCRAHLLGQAVKKEGLKQGAGAIPLQFEAYHRLTRADGAVFPWNKRGLETSQ